MEFDDTSDKDTTHTRPAMYLEGSSAKEKENNIVNAHSSSFLSIGLSDVTVAVLGGHGTVCGRGGGVLSISIHVTGETAMCNIYS